MTTYMLLNNTIKLQGNRIGAKPSLSMAFCKPSMMLPRHPTFHLLLKIVVAICDALLDERWEQDELLQETANSMYVKF
uniref:Uncharacterized protein n=1 Tax=Oryza punctata TaxID=4537 RepID=A0A0E0ML96_ORYPU